MKFTISILATSVLILMTGQPGFAQDWNNHLVDNAGDMGYTSRVVTTSDGTPYIFYAGDPSSVYNYAYLAWWVPSGDGSGAWNYFQVSYNVSLNHRSLSLRVDPYDKLHLAWVIYNQTIIRYAVFDTGNNELELPPEDAILGGLSADFNSPDIALVNDAGTIVPTIVWVEDYGSGHLKYATRDPAEGTWTPGTIYTVHSVGKQTSIAVDSTDGFHVSFYAQDGADLMYATKDAGSTDWLISYVDIQDAVGIHNSIVVDDFDTPHIVYYDQTSGNLKYAKLNGQ